MGKNKLRKFAEMEEFACVKQFPIADLRALGGDCPLKGNWSSQVFANDNPIVLELGCGKGEYAVGLARLHPEMNFIGIDIKGARIYTGAKIAEDEGLKNVAFLRTAIDLLPAFFASGEVSEIWITFPDPQMRKATKRLVGTRFLDMYRKCLADGAKVRLKTDSPFLYEYTLEMLRASGIEPSAHASDLYAQAVEKGSDLILPGGIAVPNIRTHYEQLWLDRGLNIKYIEFPLPHAAALAEPEIDIERDSYSSRGARNIPSA
ncbi:MAG: tRNA (guanosine(46)-N7)-methyltransferase TrmB [Clostridium sp.]|nr:tRNA (guanosine(46)-N7)-methyltransferase TrmB [Clostridium sp.]